jgi:FtsP/CotA-like multicopper oxidase with cupredoxin domain
MISRRTILAGLAIGGGLAATALWQRRERRLWDIGTTELKTGLDAEWKPLAIPELLDGQMREGARTYDLELRKGRLQLFPGVDTPTLGINGAYLGPTTSLQVYEGLAGLIYVEGEGTSRLQLPSDYGIDDIPLVL